MLIVSFAAVLMVAGPSQATVQTTPHSTADVQPPTPRQISEAMLLMPDNRRDLRRLMRGYHDVEFRDVHITLNLRVDPRRRAGFFCGYVRGKDEAGVYSEWMQFYARRGTAVLGTSNPDLLKSTCNSTVSQDPVDRSEIFDFDYVERRAN
jgi:hypothetical protein